jgi:hypothetical protein
MFLPVLFSEVTTHEDLCSWLIHTYISVRNVCKVTAVPKFKLNFVALVRERTIPTERPPLVGEVNANFLRIEGVAWSAQRIPTVVNRSFLDRSCYFSFQIDPQLYSRGWVDPVTDPLLLRKSGSAGNRTWDLWICSQKLWPLDHRGGRESDYGFI